MHFSFTKSTFKITFLFFCCPILFCSEEIVFKLPNNTDLTIDSKNIFYDSYCCQALINFKKSMENDQNNEQQVIDCLDQSVFDLGKVYEILNKTESSANQQDIIWLINEYEKCPVGMDKNLEKTRNADALVYAAMLAKKWKLKLQNNAPMNYQDLVIYHNQTNEILNPIAQEYLHSYLFMNLEPKLAHEAFCDYIHNNATPPITKYKQGAGKRYAWDEEKEGWDKSIYDLEEGVEKKLSDFFSSNSQIMTGYTSTQFFDIFAEDLFVFLSNDGDLKFVFYSKKNDQILHVESFSWFRGLVGDQEKELKQRICVADDVYNHVYLLNQENRHFFVLYAPEKKKLIKIQIPQPLTTARIPFSIVCDLRTGSLMNAVEIASVNLEDSSVSFVQGERSHTRRLRSSDFAILSDNDYIVTINLQREKNNFIAILHPRLDCRPVCYKLNSFLNLFYHRTKYFIKERTEYFIGDQIQFSFNDNDNNTKDLVIHDPGIKIDSWLFISDYLYVAFHKNNKNSYMLLHDQNGVRLVSCINLNKLFRDYIKREQNKII